MHGDLLKGARESLQPPKREEPSEDPDTNFDEQDLDPHALGSLRRCY